MGYPKRYHNMNTKVGLMGTLFLLGRSHLYCKAGMCPWPSPTLQAVWNAASWYSGGSELFKEVPWDDYKTPRPNPLWSHPLHLFPECFSLTTWNGEDLKVRRPRFNWSVSKIRIFLVFQWPGMMAGFNDNLPQISHVSRKPHLQNWTWSS